MRNDPASLMLYSVVKNLKKLGYKFKIYSVEHGETHSMLEDIGGHIKVLGLEQYGHMDWSMYEGVIVDSIEAKHAISSLMQDPFYSVPLIWIIQEDVLAKCLPRYSKMEQNHLISVWRSTFSRADAILFSDYSLPMLYSMLDNGNFFVIPESPLDVWSAEQFQETHDKSELRLHAGYNEDDIVVLSKKSVRSKSDDVDAVGRLPLLNETNHRDFLGEMGGMLSIANKVDNIHKRPWTGFQSWRAACRKVSLSPQAEKVLEETIKAETKGEVIYFWTRLDMDGGITGVEDVLTFWSMCDILNGGSCRNAFQLAFRKMYNLPPHIEALPPMPDDGGYWSAMHSWIMPTHSFLEFVIFARMLTDSLHTHCT